MFAVLVVAELGAALATFSKFAVIKTLVVAILATNYVNFDVRRFALWVSTLAAGYVLVLSPFVHYARGSEGRRGASDIDALARTIQGYSEHGDEWTEEKRAGEQRWWTRLSYINAQSFAMDSYDAGRHGDTLSLWLESLIPRVLYPDKPMITVGDHFNVLVTGNPDSKSAPGFWGEAYWNGGWPAVVGVSVYVGMVMAVFTWIANAFARRGRLELAPVTLMGIMMGIQNDSWFVATYVGTVAQAVVLFAVLTVLIEILRPRPRPRRVGPNQRDFVASR